MIRRIGSFTFAHLLINGLLLWLGYYWLGIGETKASTLAWSALVATALAVLTCWAYGASLTFFQDRSTTRSAWRSAVRHSLPLLAAVAVIGGIYYSLAIWEDYSSKPALTVASYLTLKFRKPVKPSTILRVLNVILFLIRWIVLPVTTLPMLASIATRGRNGFRDFGSFARRWLYWIEAPVLLLCAFAVPFKLLGWVPEVSTFNMEVVSFTLRATAAYLLFVAAWLVLAFVTSRGTPVLTQPKTAGSP